MTITIRPFEPRMARDAVSVVLPIQREEFGFDIGVDDQPDLQDIPSLYHLGKGGFWLAYDGQLPVGTIGLHDIDGTSAALRKMFVVRTHRGREHRVAARLLQALERHAEASGLSAVLLGTTERFRAAHRFYEKSGFVQVNADELPAGFLKMEVDTRFYRKRL